MRALARPLVAALLAAGCGTSGAHYPAALEVRGENGFVIQERVRVGSGVRADFEQAVRLLEQGQQAAAIPLLVGVTEAEPQLVMAHLDLGMAYSQVGDFERAEASFEQVLELNPRHPVAHNELGVVYRKTGRFEDARRSYEKALALYPDFHFARLNLAILCDLYLADPQCALEQYELYVQAVPEDKTAATWVADLRTRLGR